MSRELIRSVRSAGSATLISRLLGYFRDSAVAYAFGAHNVADAFYAAFRISNLFRRLLGEGSLASSFVPVFSEYIVKGDQKETKRFFNVIFTTLFAVLLVLCALGIIFAPQITRLITWGFAGEPDKMELTVSLTRVMFPFMLFISLAALLTGVLNSLKKFFVPAVSPAFLSASEILCIFAVIPFLRPELRIVALAYSVVAGGAGQFFIQLLAVIKKDIRPHVDFDAAHPGQKKVFRLMLPAMIGLSVDQINSFVDTVCASFLAGGSITALYYSNRIMQLPLALFGISVSSVSLPALSRSAASGDTRGMKETVNYSLRIMSLAVAPAMVGLCLLAEPVIKMLFERGNFDSYATRITAACLFFYSFGLLAFAGVKIAANCFYAMQDTKTPLKAAYICMMINVVLNILLMRPFGVGGLAMATSISSWINFVILIIFLRRRIGPLGLMKNAASFLKISAASAVMGVAAYSAYYGVFAESLYLGLPVTILLSVGIYFLLLHVFKLKELPDVVGMISNENTAGNE